MIKEILPQQQKQQPSLPTQTLLTTTTGSLTLEPLPILLPTGHSSRLYSHTLAMLPLLMAEGILFKALVLSTSLSSFLMEKLLQ